MIFIYIWRRERCWSHQSAWTFSNV